MRKIAKIALCFTLFASLSYASEQFAMSDADRAMYEELLENNPADMMLASGGNLLEELGGDAAVAKFLGVKEDALAAYLAGFPRYLEKFGRVVSIDQMLQGMMHESGKNRMRLRVMRCLTCPLMSSLWQTSSLSTSTSMQTSI